MNKIKNIALSLVIISTLGLVVSGCGGGGSDSTSTTAENEITTSELPPVILLPSETQTTTLEASIQKDYESKTILVTDENPMVVAYFVDSPVNNLLVVQKDINGKEIATNVTTENGRFLCSLYSESVDFYADSIYIGSTTCDATIFTPYNLDNINSTQGNNILRMLQVLDTDGNPDNGITLSKLPITNDKEKEVYLSNVDKTVNFNFDTNVYEAIKTKVSLDKAEEFQKIKPEEAYNNMKVYLDRINKLKNEVIQGVKNSTIYKDSEFKINFDKLVNANGIHLIESTDLVSASGGTDRAQAISPNKANTGDDIGDIFLRTSTNWDEKFNYNKEELLHLYIGSIIHETQHIIDYVNDIHGYRSLDTEINAHALEYKYYKEAGVEPSDIVGINAESKAILYNYRYGTGTTIEQAIQALNDIGYSIDVLSQQINPNSLNKFPIAKAGADQTVTQYDTVLFDASQSSDDVSILGYQWKEGSKVLSNSATFAKSDFSVGTHTITLSVIDNDGEMDTDTITVTVNNSSNKMTWLEAKAYCENQNKKLPSKIELTDAYANNNMTDSMSYWSSTEASSSEAYKVGEYGTQIEDITEKWRVTCFEKNYKITIPLEPTNTQASDGNYSDKIRITWDSVENADYYEVYYAYGISDFNALFKKTTNTNMYDIHFTDQSKSTLVYFKIKACNSIGCSPYSEYDSGFESNEETVTTSANWLIDESVSMSWTNAISYCENKNGRLPTIEELKYEFKYNKNTDSSTIKIVNGFEQWNYWSNVDAGYGLSSGISFNTRDSDWNASTFTYDQSYDAAVRCVSNSNQNITYLWKTSSWLSCSGDCGTNNGLQTRTVNCEDSNGNSASDSMCTTTKPSLTQSCTASLCHTDDHGDTTATATTMTSSTINGSIEEAGDVDYFKITLSSSGKLKLYTTGGTDTVGYLYNSEGEQLSVNDGFTDFNIEQDVVAGTYYIKVKGYNSTTDEYVLNKSFTQAVSIPTISNVTLTKENDYQKVTIRVDYNSNYGSAVKEVLFKVYDPNNKEIVNYLDKLSQSYIDGRCSIILTDNTKFNIDGEYVIKIIATNLDGEKSVEYVKAVSIAINNKPPEAKFSVSYESTGKLKATDLSTDDGSICQWNWDFGDGSVSTQQNPIYTYRTSNTYKIKLQVEDCDGKKSGTMTMSDIKIKLDTNEAPIPSFTSTYYETTGKYVATDKSTDDSDICSWLWDWKDGATSAEQNPTHYYTSSGTYKPALTVTDCDGKSATATSEDIVIKLDTLSRPQNVNACNDNGCLDSEDDIGYSSLNQVSNETSDFTPVSIVHNGISYKTVLSPYTKRIWLDRNLGASRVCESYDDEQCYGDYYQWGRRTDGHEKVDSLTSTELIGDENLDYINSNGKFIIHSKDHYGQYYNDWTFFSVDRRKEYWEKTDGNGICPVGFRVPSSIELAYETMYFGYQNNLYPSNSEKNRFDIFSDFLKIGSSGHRIGTNIIKKNSYGGLWTSSSSYDKSSSINYYDDEIKYNDFSRDRGYPVRCIKDN